MQPCICIVEEKQGTVYVISLSRCSCQLRNLFWQALLFNIRKMVLILMLFFLLVNNYPRILGVIRSAIYLLLISDDLILDVIYLNISGAGKLIKDGP